MTRSSTTGEPVGKVPPVPDVAPPVLTSRSGRRAIRNPWAILAILVLLHIVWSLDRAVPAVVAEQVKVSFDLTDAQLGLFTGLAYGLAYGVGGVIAGILIDRMNRTRLLGMMIALWSGFTVLCGLAQSYILLLASRVGVGAAESGATPASFSIISDVFPVERRATAVGIFKVGSPIGLFTASIGCAYIAAEFGWRMAFLVAGIPGLILAFVVWRYIPDPERGRFDGGAEPKPALPLLQVLGVMRRSPGVPWLVLGVILFLFANAGPTAFLMPYLQRVHDIPLTTASWYYATGNAVGMAGPLIAGLLSDRLARKGLERTLYLSAVISVATFVAGTWMVLSDNLTLVVLSLIVWQAFAVSLTAPSFATLLSLTPAETRGTVTAMLMVGMYLLGMGPAPYVAGVLSDSLGGGVMIRYALAIEMCINLLCGVVFLIAGITVKRSRKDPPLVEPEDPKAPL